MPDARPLMPVPYVWKMGIARKCPCPILSDVALPMPARPPFFLPVPTLVYSVLVICIKKSKVVRIDFMGFIN